MKKVALILPDTGLPVPAVLGGAIETLVELIADVNESEKKLDVTVYSPYNYRAEKLSKKYHRTKFIYIRGGVSRFSRIRYKISGRLKKHFGIYDGYLGRYYREVYKDCVKEKYDYIIAEGGRYSAFRKFAKRFGKDRVILHIHHHCLDNDAMAGIFGSTIAVSNFINEAWKNSKKAFPADNDQRNYALTNAVDEDRFNKTMTAKEKAELRRSLGFKDDDVIVEYVGRIIEVKGVKELVDAVIDLGDSRIKVLVIGSAGFADNPKQEYADRIVARINESHCGVRLDYVDNKDVYKYLKIADIRCFPSKWEEALSLALVEAMHCATPIIITRSGGMPEIVSKEGAVVINKDDRLVGELKNAIRKLASDPKLRQKMAAANLEQSKIFRKKVFYDNFVKIIEGECDGE